MTSLGRLAAALVVVAVCVALPFARTPAGGSRPVPTVAFTAVGLSFRYPATWQRQTWSGDEASFATPIVILSGGGVLVSWDADGFPISHLPTPNTTIGGHSAVETTTSGGAWCASLGGTETITVMIPRAVPDNWYQMDACLRGPDLTQQDAQISSMLSSVRLAQGG